MIKKPTSEYIRERIRLNDNGIGYIYSPSNFVRLAYDWADYMKNVYRQQVATEWSHSLFGTQIVNGTKECWTLVFGDEWILEAIRIPAPERVHEVLESVEYSYTTKDDLTILIDRADMKTQYLHVEEF